MCIFKTNLYLCRDRKLNTEFHYRGYCSFKNKKEVRPLTDKEFQQTAVNKVSLY